MGSYLAWGLAHLFGQDSKMTVVGPGLESAADQHQASDSQKQQPHWQLWVVKMQYVFYVCLR